ncbi:hypothetical protein [Spiroplasma endosymbiont of Villa modesta]|uniref:hypothetical protein n=1 Tax=Spiroplasma endosymbiont of Villa modesta TaxID=3066293 RepID=UPI00313AFF24
MGEPRSGEGRSPYNLLWTIPSFILYKKVSKGEATTDQKIALAILGIIFGAALGIIGGIFILVDLNNDENKIQRY